MKMKKTLLLIPTLLAVVILLAGFGGGSGQKTPTGAPAGYTGSPADGRNCTSCHGGTATTVSGIITSNVPVSGYVPGTSYTVTATLAGTGGKGFEISPQSITGTLLGSIVAGSNNHITGTKYLTHNAAVTTTPAVWSFTWVAPAAGTGSVTFYGAFAITMATTNLSTLVVNEASPPPLYATASATPSSVIQGGSSQLNVTASGGTGSYSYSWTSFPAGFTSTLQNPVVTPSATTQYNVVVTSGTQTANSNVTVTVIPTLTASASASPGSIAPGGSSQLNAAASGGTGSYTYSWTSVPAGFTSTLQNPVVTPSATTQYNVVVTSGTQTAASNITVTVIAGLTASASANPTSVIQGASSQLNVTASGGTGSYTYSWTSVPAGFTSTLQNPVVTPSATTQYNVVVTSGTQTAASSATVTVIAGLTASASANPTSVIQGASSQLNVTASGGTGSYSYSWTSFPAGFTSILQNPVVTPSATTQYNVVVTSGTQTAASSATVTVIAGLTASASANPTSVIQGASSQLNVTASGGTGSYSYSWTSVPAGFTSTLQNPVVTPSATAQYNVVVTSGTQTVASSATVTVIAGLTASASANPTSVIQGASSQLNVTASGGAGSYSYSWTSVPAGFTSTLQNPVVTPSVTTQYNVVVTSGTQTANSNVTVTVIPTLTASASASPGSIAPGGSSQLNVAASGGTGSYSYSWTSVPAGFTSTLQNPVVTPSATTQYNVVVTSGTQTAASSATVTVIAGLTASASANPTSVIQGASSQLNVTASGGTGSYSYSWTSFPAGFTSTLQNPVVAPSATTQYNVVVTSGTQTANSNVTVTVIPTLTAYASASPGSIAPGGSSQLNAAASGGTGSYTYSWTSVPGGFTSTLQNPVVSPAVSTTYNVVVTSDNQTASSSVTVAVGNELTASASANPQTIIQGENSQLNVLASGGTGSYSYAWSSAPSGFNSTLQNPVVSPGVTTTYSVEVTSGGATVSASVTVTVIPLLNANASASPSSVVPGGSSQLAANASGGTGSYSYSWTSNPAGFTSAIADPVVSPSVTTSYTVLVTSGTQSKTSSVTVTVNSVQNLRVRAHARPSTIERGERSHLYVTASGGSGQYQYSWTSIPAGFTSTLRNPIVRPRVSTQYIVTVTSGNQSGTASTRVRVIHDDEQLAVNGQGVQQSNSENESGTPAIKMNSAVSPGMNNEIVHVILSPNPCSTAFQVSVKGDAEGLATISVMDFVGKTVSKETLNLKEARSIRFDVSIYPKGMYLVVVQIDKTTYTSKLVVQ